MGLKRKLTKKKLIEAGLDKEKFPNWLTMKLEKRTKEKSGIFFQKPKIL